MSGAFRLGSTIVGLAGLAGILAGCGTGITGDTSLSDALSSLAQTVAADPNLSKLTVSDVVQGFEAYASQFADSSAATGEAAGTPPTPLTADQQAQLEALQGQLDSGAITQAEFAQQVQALIGDVAPGRAFAGMDMLGGPFGGDPVMGLADQLQLTDDQRTQAEAIFTALHTDIETLRQNAQDQIQAMLTADQLASLEALQSQNPPPPPGGPRSSHMGPPAGTPSDNAQPPEPGLDIWTRLADELQLTDDQQTAIETIRSDLRDAVEARHQQARDDFRAILTADQLTLLDQIEAEHQPPEQ